LSKSKYFVCLSFVDGLSESDFFGAHKSVCGLFR